MNIFDLSHMPMYKELAIWGGRMDGALAHPEETRAAKQHQMAPVAPERMSGKCRGLGSGSASQGSHMVDDGLGILHLNPAL